MTAPSPEISTPVTPGFRRDAVRWGGFAALVVAGLLGGRLFGPVTSRPAVGQEPAASAAPLTELEAEVRELAAQLSPSVVAVLGASRGGLIRAGTYAGSGFVIDAAGHVLTSADSVASGRRRVTVAFAGGRRVSARVVARDSFNDVVLLKLVPPAGAPLAITPLRLGDSDAVRVGSWCLTLGNPAGTIVADERVGVSLGLVSGRYRPNTPRTGALSRRLGTYRGPLLETDAAVNEGSFGGPLVDRMGRVLGVVTRTVALQKWQGTAVPINQVRLVLDRLRRGQGNPGPDVGFTLTASAGGAPRLNSITPDGPGAKAGLRPGDNLLAIDTTPVTGSRGLVAARTVLQSLPPGAHLRLTVGRGARTLTLGLTVALRGTPPGATPPETPPVAPAPGLTARPLARIAPTPALGALSEAFATAARRVAPAVVAISIPRRTGGRSRGRIAGLGELSAYRQRPDGPVSGVIIDAAGHVLTAGYNVEGVPRNAAITVQLGDGRKFAARLLGRNEVAGLGMVRIVAGRNLPVAPLGDSTKVRVGQYALLVGRSLNAAQFSLTQGVVSALDRLTGGTNAAGDVGDFGFSAQVNYGNTGGALIDLSGNLIGIAHAISNSPEIRHGLNSGVGFAIPWHRAEPLLPGLRAGRVQTRTRTPFLGVTPNQDVVGVTGVTVTSVIEGTGAAQAKPLVAADGKGIKKGDILVEFDGSPVTTVGDLRRVLARHKAGDVVPLTLVREGRRKRFLVTLSERR